MFNLAFDKSVLALYKESMFTVNLLPTTTTIVLNHIIIHLEYRIKLLSRGLVKTEKGEGNALTIFLWLRWLRKSVSINRNIAGINKKVADKLRPTRISNNTVCSSKHNLLVDWKW